MIASQLKQVWYWVKPAAKCDPLFALEAQIRPVMFNGKTFAIQVSQGGDEWGRIYAFAYEVDAAIPVQGNPFANRPDSLTSGHFDLEEAAKYAADRIGHGMTEKCEHQAALFLEYLAKNGLSIRACVERG